MAGCPLSPSPHKDPSTLVELSVSARNLRDMDLLSKSDPVCILYTKSYSVKDWIEHDRTEIIMNNLNPDFVKKFKVHYVFEEKKFLKFELYDVDKKQSFHRDLNSQDFLGEFESSLGQLVSCMEINASLIDSKTHRKPKGTLIVTAEKRDEKSREHITLQFKAEDLKDKLIGHISPYCVLYKLKEEEDGFTKVYRSKTRSKTARPEWETFQMSCIDICNAQKRRKMKISVFDDCNGADKDLGSTDTFTIEQLLMDDKMRRLELKKNKKKSSDQPKICGYLIVGTIMSSSQANFMDFLQGGMEINVSLAVDFTRSNGDPKFPNSLHHHTPSQYSPYARAIQSVLTVTQDYNRSKDVAGFGFGAKKRDSNETIRLFPLCGDASERWPTCKGLDGILKAYRDALNNYDLYGPTNFAPIIEFVKHRASRENANQSYHLLLILTDGNIDDMQETKKELVEAADTPMSVVIIGVGSEDFSAMKILDGDNKLLTYKGIEASRDIVQFVEFNNFDMQSDNENIRTLSGFANEVLKEVPDQVLAYMKNSGISPSVSSRCSISV